MAQKSILSFFGKTNKPLQSSKSDDYSKPSIKREVSPAKAPEEPAKLNGHSQKEGSAAGCSNPSKNQNGLPPNDMESPLKRSKRKATTLIESDEESNQSQDEADPVSVKNESVKMEVDADSKVGESLQGNEENTSSPAKLNGEMVKSSDSSSKKRRNNSEDSPTNSSKKIKLTDDSPVKTKILSILSHSVLNSQSTNSVGSCNRTSQLPPPPPKRKTARKSMSAERPDAINSSPSNESKESIFPNLKTYEKKNIKKRSEIAQESSSVAIKSCEDVDKDLKAENETSAYKSEELEERREEFSEKKPQAIHPFFVSKNKKEISPKEKIKSENKKAEDIDKSSSDNESSSPVEKKGKKKADDSSKKSKSTVKVKTEKVDENAENSDKDNCLSEGEYSSPSPKKNKNKKKSVGKAKQEFSIKLEKEETENNEEKVQESDKESCSSDESSSAASKKNKMKSGDKKESKVSKSDQEKASDSSNGKKKTINSSSTSSGVLYDPSKSKYHPIDDACWKRSEKVPYLALAKTLELIENTSARLKIVEILANYFRSVTVLTPEDLLQSVYLCLNRIAPEYEGIELGVGDMVLMKAVAQATGRTLDKIRAEVKEKGDLGLVAESSRGNQKVMFAPPKLTVASVFSKFKEIAKMSGNAAMAKKTDKIQALFVACWDCEAKYIIRSLSGKLRIGLAEQSVLAALGRAIVLTPPGQSYPPEIIDKSSGMSSEKFKKLQDEKVLILKTTYCECPNYDLVIPVLLKEGIDRLSEHCQLSPGCPLKPMLAHPTAGIDEVLQRFDNNEFTCEFKYDGERAQIHRTDKGEVKIFSRNQEDNTSKYPDIIARVSKVLKDTTKSFILDTEAVAWDREAKQILPFQILSTRKKKDAVESEIVVQVSVMAFDLLYLNGESLVKKPLKERRALLHSSFVEVPNEFMFVTYADGNSAETMQEFLDESIKGNCEGLMVKSLLVDASYEIAKRSHNWLKLKKDYLDGVGDTLDLVVIGGYHGKGKRTGTYGGFLLACYDNENEEFQSICKLGTGFKEDELEAHTKFLKNHVISAPKSYYRYDHSLEPDEWFEPEQIWEVKCADLSISPIHKAAIGIVDPEKGISLRFPRFLRIRDDKKVEEATNASQIAEMYQKQDQVQNMKTKPKNEEDYY